MSLVVTAADAGMTRPKDEEHRSLAAIRAARLVLVQCLLTTTSYIPHGIPTARRPASRERADEVLYL